MGYVYNDVGGKSILPPDTLELIKTPSASGGIFSQLRGRGYMTDVKRIKQCIQAASGEKQPELVLKNARVVNVFTNELEEADVAIENGVIAGLGDYTGVKEIDLQGKIVCPGFIDGHIHIESSMVTPDEFECAVMPHGTTGVVTDPHEITNVAGLAGLDYMIEITEKLDIDVYFTLPSCVPSTELDEAGAVLEAEDLEPYYSNDRVIGLAEIMNSYGTVKADEKILRKLNGALKRGLVIDGHAPFITGKQLNAYAAAGVVSDHECSEGSEAVEKLRRGQWIMIREGTAAKNLDALLQLFEEPYYNRAMLVTDDKHPGDLIKHGHIDYIIKRAIENGKSPFHAIRMATLNPAQYFGLKKKGAVAPGYDADIVVISDFNSFTVEKVFKAGRLVAENGSCIENEINVKQVADISFSDEIKRRVFDSFQMKEITKADLQINETGENKRVIWLTPKQLLTEEKIMPFDKNNGGICVESDVIKLAVFERHFNTGHVGVGFIGGYGLKRGAVASSVSHDSHNLIIAGVSDEDMIAAGNRVRENRGGLAVALDGKIIGELPLPVAGIMSDRPAEEIEEKLLQMKKRLREMGIPEEIDPFMTLAFVSLPVIPALRLNTYGVIDTQRQKVVKSIF